MVNKANAFVCSFFILLSLLFRSTTLYAKDEALPVSDYVNDYAGIMSSGTQDELDALGRQLESETGAQVVIVTTDSLHGADAMKVATDTANKAQLGSGEKDNGVLILVSIDDKQRFMAVGSGLEGDLTDIDCEHLQQDYLVPAFRQGNYDQGLNDLYVHTVAHIADAYGADLDQNGTTYQEPAYEDTQDEGSSSLSGFILVATILVLSAVFLMRRPNKGASSSTLHLRPNQRYSLTIPGIHFETDTVVVGSTDPEIASITPTGVISAKKTGETIVSVQDLKSGTRYKYRVIVSRSGGTRRRRDPDLFDAMMWGSMMGRGGRRHSGNPFGGGGFGGHSSGGGFSGGGGGFRGGGSGGSW